MTPKDRPPKTHQNENTLGTAERHKGQEIAVCQGRDEKARRRKAGMSGLISVGTRRGAEAMKYQRGGECQYNTPYTPTPTKTHQTGGPPIDTRVEEMQSAARRGEEVV